MASASSGGSRVGSVKSQSGKFYHAKSTQAKVIKTARKNRR